MSEFTTVKVNGAMLQTALRHLKSDITFISKQASANETYFDSDEERKDLTEILAKLTSAEMDLAQLQTAQSTYNQSLTITVQSKPMSLHLGIKLLGTYGRLMKRWKDLSEKETSNPYEDRMGRDVSPTKQFPKLSIRPEDALKKSRDLDMTITQLRSRVNEANSKEIEISIPSHLTERIVRL